MTKISYQTRALMLVLRLNKDAMLYTPLSFKGQRAARLIPLIRSKMA